MRYRAQQRFGLVTVVKAQVLLITLVTPQSYCFLIHQHATASTAKRVIHLGNTPGKTIAGKNSSLHPKGDYKTYLWFREMFSHCGSSVSFCENVQAKNYFHKYSL